MTAGPIAWSAVASSNFGQFHDRQVCSLEPDEFDEWMSETDPKRLVALLHPPAEAAWEAVPVDDRIFRHGRIETEDLIPIGAPVRGGAPVSRA